LIFDIRKALLLHDGTVFAAVVTMIGGFSPKWNYTNGKSVRFYRKVTRESSSFWMMGLMSAVLAAPDERANLREQSNQAVPADSMQIFLI
jgi:hypothetical protein